MSSATVLLDGVPLVPVVTVPDAAQAVPLVRALVGGGLRVVEITLRTPAGLDAIEEASSMCADATVGAGSVMSTEQAIAAIGAGARFLVSPGCDPAIIDVAREREIAVIPGVATATEMMRAHSMGCDVVKVFPAAQIGGPALIRSFASVWPDMRFVPTGGIDQSTAPDYLEIPAVLSVGGSWMVPSRALDAHDWPAVTVAAACALDSLTERP